MCDDKHTQKASMSSNFTFMLDASVVHTVNTRSKTLARLRDVLLLTRIHTQSKKTRNHHAPPVLHCSLSRLALADGRKPPVCLPSFSCVGFPMYFSPPRAISQPDLSAAVAACSPVLKAENLPSNLSLPPHPHLACVWATSVIGRDWDAAL